MLNLMEFGGLQIRRIASGFGGFAIRRFAFLTWVSVDLQSAA